MSTNGEFDVSPPRHFTLRQLGTVDFASQDASGISTTVLEAITYWEANGEANGVRFRIASLGAANVGTGETVYERRERIVVDNAPLFLLTAPEWAYLRQHEAEFIRYLKGRD